MSAAGRFLVYTAVAAVLLVAYAIVAPQLWIDRGFDADGAGPLSKLAPAATTPPPGARLTPDEAVQRCRDEWVLAEEPHEDERLHLVAAVVDGAAYYACYDLREDGGVIYGGVIDARTGELVTDPAVLKPAGVWRWLAAVKTPFEVAGGGAAAAAWLWMHARYHRRRRPSLTLPQVLRRSGWFTDGDGVGESDNVRLLYLIVFAVGWATLGMTWGEVAVYPDALAVGVVGMVTAAALWGTLGGWWLLRGPASCDLPPWPVRESVAVRPPGLPGDRQEGLRVSGRRRWWRRSDADDVATGPDVDRPTASGGGTSAGGEQRLTDAPTGEPPSTVRLVSSAPPASGAATSRRPDTVGTGEGTETRNGPGRRAPAVAPRDDAVEVDWGIQEPDQLPTFTDVGGMQDLKEQLRDTVGLLLAFGTEAEAFRITYNGILLHGPPGTGKTFLARATAGEHGLRFLRVDVSDIVSKWVGESARNIRAAFEAAAANIPCLLFFDEFDAIAARRDDEATGEARRTVNQLLQSIEEWRDVRELVVVAATNHLDRLDPAVIRPGRFDKHVRIDLPDREARRAVLAAQLRGRPCAADLDLDVIAARTEGMTPAAIASCVEAAALAAFRETALEGHVRALTTGHLLGALQARGGQDRPSVEGWSWDRLVLDEDTKAELRRLQLLVEDPERARNYGVAPPTGMLLAGPPGTGKTTIARVLAAEGDFSFYPVTVTDLTSKWVGESEEKVARLFQRARENAPSVIFIDEIDAVAAKRGAGDYGDRLVNQLLAEMDGVSGRGRVFVIAATNRPELLDPALTRGGRLSRTIEVPLPAREQRRGLLSIFTEPMPLRDVDLDALAAGTDGWTGADLEALCQQAAVEAMVRDDAEASREPSITPRDVEVAMAAVRAAASVAGPSSGASG